MKKILLLFMLIVLSSFVFAEVTEENILSWYGCENDITDSHGNLDGGVQGSPTFDSNRIVGSYSCGGFTNSDYYTLPAYSYPSNSNSSGAISLWVYFDDIDTHGILYHEASTGYWYSHEAPATNDHVRFYDYYGSVAVVKSSSDAVGNSWYNFIVMWNSTATYMYWNNTLVGTSSAGIRPTINGNPILRLGVENGVYAMSGEIDEIAFFSDDLSEEQRSTLFGNGAGCDYDCFIASLQPITNFTITASTFFFNTSISNFNATVDGTLYQANGTQITTGLLDNSTILHNITVIAANHDNRSYLNYNVSSNLAAVLNYSYYKLNVSAYNSSGDGLINNFTITATSATDSQEVNTTSGSVELDLNKEENYTITVDAQGYAYGNDSILMDDWIKYLNFSLYTTNSISITVRDESTNALITEDINVTFSSDMGETTHTASGGSLYVDEIDAAEYTLTFSAAGYSTRAYVVTISNRSTQTLNAFLTKATGTTTFTIKDKDTAQLIEDVLTTMYRIVNGSWQAVESKNSDITGRAQFTYDANVNYRFYFSHASYEDLIFYLTPVLFSEYDVQMKSITTINSSLDYDRIAITYSPEVFYEGNNSFSFLIQSPYGELLSYGYNISFPGGSKYEAGFNAIGSQLESTFTISGSDYLDTVKLEYFYSTSLSGRRNFTYYFPVTGAIGNNTMMDNRNRDYGLSLFEKALVVTLIGLFIMGISSLVGKPVPGAVITLGVWGYMVFIGMINWWLVGIAIVVGFIYLTSQPEF